ncbi:MAG: DedA family protein [Sedimentisphaerales bacterium]|jgi:membrane-associated protein
MITHLFELILRLIDFLLHLDKHLSYIIENYGLWCYAIFFLIIFCETGLVVMPFLPGDSLLFALGALAAAGSLKLTSILPLLAAAAVLGDNTNYWIGFFVGPKIFHKENVRILNKKHLDRTHQFYEKHGGKTVIIARFMPIFRTFAPFVAGIGRMTYWRFLAYSIAGTIAWTGIFIMGGFCFGNIPFVKRNFSMVILAIIILSIMPAVIEVIREKRRHKN